MKTEPESEASMTEERRWNKIETAGHSYSARTGHTAVSYGSMLYVFGGTDRKRRQQDLFQFDIESNKWSPVMVKGTLPPRRSGALGIVHEEKIFIFGGYDGRDGYYFNDLYYLNIETRQWNEMPSIPRDRPEPRTDHIMVPYNSSIYVFGGYDGNIRYNNMHQYCLEKKKWDLVDATGTIPSRRFGHSGAVHEKSGRLFVFGGWDGRDTLADLYAFDFNEKLWTKIQTEGSYPPHRYRHTAIIHGDSMFVFGGVDKAHQRFNDLQRLDLNTMVWSEVSTTGCVPSSRTFHRAVVVQDQMYLLGGYDGTDRLHDLFSIHVGNQSPSSLLDISATYVRNNLNDILKNSTFDYVPEELISYNIWRRDSSLKLRGGCGECRRGKCNIFEAHHKNSQNDDQNNLKQIEQDLCICGHKEKCHERIPEEKLYSTRRQGPNKRLFS